MIKAISIKNFKSVLDTRFELGRVNVFIGENGCGKTNILEAIAMASAAKEGRLDVEGMYSKGIRVARPELLMSSFYRKKQHDEIKITISAKEADTDLEIASTLIPEDYDLLTKWNEKEKNLENKLLGEIIGEIFSSQGSVEATSVMELLERRMSASPAVKEFQLLKSQNAYLPLLGYVIYSPNTKSLRGIYSESKKEPLGINGENLDLLINSFNPNEQEELTFHIRRLISWLEDVEHDEYDMYKQFGLKLGKSSSRLYFRDRFMGKQNNLFSAENANEGILHLLFYLALMISRRTPSFLAIDNIETALNPRLCTEIMCSLCELAPKKSKQMLITTHNPAVLDGLNLFDDEIRLFEVFRSDKGHTDVRRIQFREGKPLPAKLSELWMSGHLGAVPANF